jgi:preprotein translocase subunit SecE
MVTSFSDEVVSELRKVTWPSRDDVVKSTTVVLVCVLIASFILAGFDLIWGKVIGFLLHS